MPLQAGDCGLRDTLTLSATGPAWLVFNAGTRTFSGTPPAAGTSTVTLTATDSEGLAALTTFVIVVADSGIVVPPSSGPTLLGPRLIPASCCSPSWA